MVAGDLNRPSVNCGSRRCELQPVPVLQSCAAWPVVLIWDRILRVLRRLALRRRRRKPRPRQRIRRQRRPHNRVRLRRPDPHPSPQRRLLRRRRNRSRAQAAPLSLRQPPPPSPHKAKRPLRTMPSPKRRVAIVRRSLPHPLRAQRLPRSRRRNDRARLRRRPST